MAPGVSLSSCWCGHGLTDREVEGQEFIVDKHIVTLIDLINRKYISRGSSLQTMDLARKASIFTIDIITDVAFGQPWGYLSQDEDVGEWFSSFEKIMPNPIRASTIPWIQEYSAYPLSENW